MDSSSGGDDSKSAARTRSPSTLADRRLLFEKRIALFAVLAALPGMAFGTILIWTQRMDARRQDLAHRA